MISLQDLLHQLQKTFSFYTGSDYGPNGLQVEGKKEIRRIGFAVSASLDSIEKAKGLGCDALITHHGLFWDKDPYVISGPKKKKLEILLKEGISLLSYHLPLDAHPTLGNNYKASFDLGMRQQRPFGKACGVAIGVAAEFDPISIDAFIQKLEKYYNHKAIVSLASKQKITSCGIISGGAYKMIVEAAADGLDCFVTGNFDEPAWDLAKELGVHFIALGHHATEKVGIQALQKELESLFPIPCSFIDSENPF